jgi:hypothetical protein
MSQATPAYPDSVRNFNAADVNGGPSPSELASMIDAQPRPPLSEYETWLAAGTDPHHAAECRAFECTRARLMQAIYGEVAQ